MGNSTLIATRKFFSLVFLFVSLGLFAQTITTDKVDYFPDDVVLASGNGWGPFEVIDLNLKEQTFNNLGDAGLMDVVTADASGSFTKEIYTIVEADRGAFFHLLATGRTSQHEATITFNDAGGDYGIDFSAYDPAIYDRYLNGEVTAPNGRGNSPLGSTSHGSTVESLQPSNLGLGQIVAFEYFVRADTSGACMDDTISIGGEWLTETTNGGAFGFDGNLKVIGAFVDTGADASLIDTGSFASVSSFTSNLVGNTIESTVEISGMDPGDEIIVEVWLVLQSSIPQSVGGNVKTRLGDAATIGNCEVGKINTGNQEVPLLQVGDFFSADVDISVTKSDDVDPINQGGTLTYTITTNNAGPSVANSVVITDTLDPNVTFVSASDGGTHNAGVVTWDVGALGLGETVVYTVTVTVNGDAPTDDTTVTQCGTGDIGNLVTIVTISDDTNPVNNSDCEPTDVENPFVCPTLSNESPDITTCEDDQGQLLSVETDVNNIDIKFVYFSSPQTNPYAGGTQLGTIVTPAGGTATSSEGISGLALGTYYAYGILDITDQDLTDANCRPSAVIVITITPKPVAPEVTTTQPTCEEATGSVSVDTPVVGSTYTLTGTNPIVADQTGTSFTGLAPGTYDLIETNEAGCESMATQVVIEVQPDTPVAPEVTTTQPTCEEATGSVSVDTPVVGSTYTLTGTNPIVADQTGTSFTGLAPGTYDLIETNEAGCESMATQVVIEVQPDTPVAPEVTTTQPTCEEATGSVSVDTPVVGSTYTLTGTNPIVADQTGTSFTGLAPGTYDLIETNEAGCESMATQVVIEVQPDTPVAPEVTTTQPTCEEATGSVSVENPIGTSTYTLTGTDPVVADQTGTSFTGLAPGTYDLIETNDAGCESMATQVVIEAQPDTPVAPEVTTTQPTCEEATGSVSVDTPVVGSTYTLTGTNPIVADQTGTSFTGLAPGTYDLIETNEAGCESMATQVVIEVQPDTPVAPEVTTTQPTCEEATGSVSVDTPVVGSTYTLTGTNPIVADQTGTSFTGLAPGTYDLIETNDAGCESMATQVVIEVQPDTPVAPEVTTTQPTCEEATGSVSVDTPVVGSTYTLTGTNPIVADQTGTSFTGLAPGTYDLIETNDAGCESMATQVVIEAQPDTPVAPEVTTTQPTCEEATGSVSVDTPVVGSTYTLTGTNPIVADQTGTSFTGLAPGTYDLIETNEAGCESMATQVVIEVQPDTPVAPEVTTTQPTCEEATGSVSVDTPVVGSTYTLTGTNPIVADQTGTSFTGLAPGTYDLIETNEAGCESMATQVVIEVQPDTPVAPEVTTTQPTCEEATGSVSVDTPVVGSTYTLTGTNPIVADQTGTSFTGLAPGTYDLIETNDAGCESMATQVVIEAQPDTPVAPEVTTTQPTCEEATGSVSVDTPVVGSTYTLTGTNPIVADQTGTSFTGLAPGTYDLIETNESGCESMATQVVIEAQPDTPVAPEVTTTQPTCEEATGSVSVENPIGTSTYTLTGTDPVVADQTGTSFTGLAPGTYDLIETNDAGCESMATQVVIEAQPDTPVAPEVTTTQPTCEEATGSVSVDTPVVGSTYTLTGTNPIVADQTGTSFTGLAPGTYDLIETNEAGCESMATQVVIEVQPDTPVAPEVTTTQPTCEEATGSVSVDTPVVGSTYTLTGTNPIVADQTGTSFTGLAPGTYDLIETNEAGCESMATQVVIEVQPDTPVAPIVTVVDATCEAAGSASIVPVAGLTYTVSPSGTVEASGTITGLTAGTEYTVTAENASGCTADSVEFTVVAQPDATEGINDFAIVCSDASYKWDVTGMEYTVADSPVSVLLEDDNGCSYTAILTLTREEAPDAGADNIAMVCEGTSVDLSELVSVEGGMFLTTNGGVISGTDFDTTGLLPGDYVIEYTVKGSNICPDDVAEITVSVAEDIIVQSCEAVDATFCGDGTKYNFYWIGSKASPGGSNFFGSNASNNLSFTEFNDGTALVQGTTILGSCTATLYIKLIGKKDWDAWQNEEGGTFKNMGCTNPNPANLEYYVIDNSVSTITTNGGDCLEEGTFIVSQKPDPNDPLTPHLGVIVGPGGVLHGVDATADGIAGWGFMGTEENPKKYEIDFNFELSCTDATGCDLEQSCDNLVPNAGVSSSYTACADEVVTMNDLFELLGTTAEIGGTWTPEVFNGPDEYTYTHAANGTCLEKSATITIAVQGKLSAGLDGAITVCEGDILSTEDLFALLNGADEGGSWSDSVAGIYTYTVGGSGKCSEDTATVTVTYVATPNAGIDGELIICEGTTPTDAQLFEALMGKPDKVGTWSRTPGLYTYTVQSEGDCFDEAFVQVIEKTPNAGQDGTLTICAAAEVPSDSDLFAVLTGADEGGTWSGPVNLVYTYTVPASGNCPEDSATVEVMVEDALSAGVSASLSLCEGTEVTMADLFTELGDMADAGGTWSPATFTGAGIYTYTHAATATCPEDSATVDVTVGEALSAGVSASLSLCEGTEVTMADLFTELGDMADAGGTWSPATFTGAGIYTYTHAATATCPEDSATVDVTVGEALSAGVSASLSLCEGTEVTMADLFTELGDMADAGGTWSPATFTGAGIYTYTHTATATCPEDSATVDVTVGEALSAGVSASLSLCEGTEVTMADLFTELGDMADAGGTWSPATFTGAGIYTYTVPASGNCPEDSATVDVMVEDALSAGVSASLSLCEGTEVTMADLFAELGDMADAGGTWSPATFTGAGIYTYTHAATATCPEDSATVEVMVEDALSAGVSASLSLCEGTEVTMADLFTELGDMADAGGTWSPATFTGAGIYTYTHTATTTCPEDSATVEVDEDMDCDNVPVGCETAFAYYETNNVCFLNDDSLKANRWGWTNYFAQEGNYTMDLYSGAGQCDLSKGVKSGDVNVNYVNGEVSISIDLLPGFVMNEVQIYVGDEKYPVKNGKPTVAPGQYPFVDESLNNAIEYEYGPIDVSSNGIYIIVHAVTCASNNVAAKYSGSTIVTAFPTIFKNELTVQVESAYASPVSVEMYDMNGRLVVYKKDGQVGIGANEIQLNVGNLAPDMYILILKTDKEKFIRKVISKK